MTRTCDCFVCGLVPFGLTAASSVSVSFVFPFISYVSAFGRRVSGDFCSRNELFLLGVRVSFLVIFGLDHMLGSVTRWDYGSSGIFSNFLLFFGFSIYSGVISPNKSQ